MNLKFWQYFDLNKGEDYVPEDTENLVPFYDLTSPLTEQELDKLAQILSVAHREGFHHWLSNTEPVDEESLINGELEYKSLRWDDWVPEVQNIYRLMALRYYQLLPLVFNNRERE